MQTHGSRDTKNRNTSFATLYIPLQSERALPISLSEYQQNQVGWEGAADRGRNKEKADESRHQCPPLPHHSHSLHHDTSGSLRMNLIYSKEETYSGNSSHFSLLLQQGFTVCFLKA